MLDSHFHDIDRVDRTDDARPCERPLSVCDTGRLEIRYDREILLYFSLEASFGKFLAQDRIRFAHSLHVLLRLRIEAVAVTGVIRKVFSTVPT